MTWVKAGARVALCGPRASSPHLACGFAKKRTGSPQGALAYIRRFYFDSALCGHKVPLDALRGFVPPGQILFGSDYPYVNAQIALQETAGFDVYQGFSADERQMAERGNAELLFPRRAKR